ncbi:MAG: hypothetical protein AAGH65_12955, partial [Pseudomonadota bacterium]
MLLVAAALVLEAILHWQLLEPVTDSRILTVGGLAEIVVWSLLAMLLVATQVWQLPSAIRSMLTIGLSLWLIAATADLLD